VTLWFLLVYLGLQAALGVWASRGIRSESDFLVAGRRVSTPLLAISMFATWFGAETCLGSSGAVYTSGLSGARADPLGYSLCLLLMGLLLATRLWRGGFVTLGDVYRRRFGAGIERLAVLVLVPSSIIWGAAQVRAFGQVVSLTMDVDVTFAVYCSALFVIGYTFLGGLAGDVVTDFVQGLIVALGLLGLVAIAVVSHGGLTAAAASIDPRRLTVWVAGENPWAQIDRWAVPVLGSLVGQELVARVLASKTAGAARSASVAACVLYLIVGSSPVLLGLLGPSLMPGLENPEQLLPSLARTLLPDLLYAVFSCALLSAILSTINSVLLACAGLLSHNVLVPSLGLRSERTKLLSVRLLVIASGAVSLWIALYADGVYELVEMASGFGTAGVVVTTFAALFLPWGNRWSAGLALLTGVVATPLAEYVGAPAPFLTSLATSCVAYAAAAVFSPARRAPAVADEQLALGVTDPGP
jgi:solute:Na+ symporter, SSS family